MFLQQTLEDLSTFFLKKTEDHSNRLDILQGIELQEKEENKDKKHIEKLMTKSPITNGENIPCKAEWWIYIDQAHSYKKKSSWKELGLQLSQRQFIALEISIH